MDRLWLPYDERQNHHVQPIVPAWAFLAGVALMAFAACRHMRAPRQLLVPTSMLLTLWAAETLLIGVDVIQDPTSHNLAPLEYVFLMILMLPAYVGAVVAMVLDKRENRHPGAN
jgi:peptidoglycan/LPS O-acetylase OafA/YrhL